MDYPTQRLDPNDPDLPPDAGALDDAVAPPAMTCPRCRGERLWTEVEDNITGSSSSNGILFKRRVGTSHWLGLPEFGTSYCRSLVCLNCSFAEFYAIRPQDLLGDTR